MKNIRIISMVLAICVVLSAFTVLAAENTVTGTNESVLSDKYNLVFDLGIINNIPADLTRGSFAVMLANALQYDYSSFVDRNIHPYEDVHPSMDEYDAIEWLTSINVLRGKTEATYQPETKITYEEALTMICRALGFEKLASQRGLFIFSKEIGLCDDMKVSNKGILDGKDAVMLIYNMIHAKVNGSPKFMYEYNNDFDKFYYQTIDLQIVRGVITDDGVCSMEGESRIRENHLVIDGVTYVNKTGKSNLFAHNIIGYYWINDNGDGEIISLRSLDIEATIIDADDLTSYNNYVYTTTNEYDRVKKYKLAKNFRLIYNGRAVEFDAALTDEVFKKLMTPHSGSVMLISTKKDSYYNIVRVTSYSNFVVGKVTLNENDDTIIIDKNDASVKYTIDSSMDVSVMTKTGSVKTVKSIAENMSVAVAQSYDKKAVSIIIGDYGKKAEIKVFDTYSWTIDGIEYDISYEYNEFLKNNPDKMPLLASQGELHLTWDDKILMFDTGADSRMMYALFGQCETYGMGEVKVNVYTEENNYMILDVASKIRIDGKPEKKSKAAEYFNNYADVLNLSIVRIRYNDNNELLAIDTPYTEADGFTSNGFEVADSLHYIKNIKEKTHGYSQWLGTFEGQVIVDNQTKFFMLDPAETDISNTRVLNLKSNLFEESLTSSTISAYTSREGSKKAEAMLLRTKYYADAKDLEMYRNLELCVIKKVATALNKNGEAVTRLDVSDGYYEHSYECTIDNACGMAYIEGEGKRIPLGEGDLIRIGVAEGNIIPEENIVMMYDYSEDKMYCTGNYTNPNAAYSRNSFSNPMGYVYDREEGFIEFTDKDPANGIDYNVDTTTLFATANADLMIISKNNGRVKFTYGNMTDIVSYKDSTTDYDKRIIIGNRYGELYAVFVYR